MQTIADKIAKLEKFQREIEENVIEATKQHESQMIGMNQDNLFAGIDSEGDEIGPDYRPFTIELKRMLRQPTNRVTLKDTGDFYKSIFLTFGKTSIFFDAKDWKFPDLIKKYGSDILGITDEDLDDLRELIKPDLIELFRRETA